MATSLSKDKQLDMQGLAIKATDADFSGGVTAATMAVTTFTPTTIAGGAFSTMPIIPTATVAAAGANQGAATAITTGFTLVTGADDAKGVRLPTAVAGSVCIIANGAASKDLKVYPGTSDAINAITADSPYTMADATTTILVAYDATTWYSIPLVAS